MMALKRSICAFMALILMFALYPAAKTYAESPGAVDLPVTYRDFHGAD
jgi:hypothetical protein